MPATVNNTDALGVNDQGEITFDLDTVPERDRARVAAMIPDPRIAENYTHRDLWGLVDFAYFDYAIRTKKNIILRGPTGSAKTTVFRAYAAARGLPFCRVNCNGGMDLGTIIGGPTGIDPETGQATWEDGNMTLVARYGGVLLIDEINMAHQRITAGFHELLDVSRRMSVPENHEVVIAGRGGLGEEQPTLFGAAYNPREAGYEGTVRMNAALRNRYPMPITWDYSREVEEQRLDSTRLLDQAWNMRSLEDIGTPVSTNMLEEFEEHARDLGMDAAIGFFLNHFEDHERGAVSRVFEANADAIAGELGVPSVTVTVEDLTN